ncbi:MAG: 4-(cytidine 5'-diphospho)-2-C-methyl-D-erythritol kinase, partial [Fulvivirga sp.]|nr:4-(cytidine 5'-diphospho)-2-C-methyl-D-erythritol kinase [Fulvivirga sp.]
DTQIESVLNLPVSSWDGVLTNDFETSIFHMYPEIGIIKKDLQKAGALYASMSGSGSSVYGIFENKPKLPAKLSDMISWQGAL